MNLREPSLAVLVVLVSVLCSGCSKDNPGTWPRDKVSAKVMESLEMTEVTLSLNPAGGFSGTGIRADGETLTLTVTQDSASHQLGRKGRPRIYRGRLLRIEITPVTLVGDSKPDESG